MALTGNTVQSTYLDLVQLEQSGAGLPSHAGKEAALYDGSGAQILGRSAVRHWLDPDPDAISGSYEFSTMGDMTQGELETAGWTFSGCTGAVSGGALHLTATGTGRAVATSVVSLSGDFDYICSSCWKSAKTRMNNYSPWAFAIADSVSDVMHLVYGQYAANRVVLNKRSGMTFSTASGGLDASCGTVYGGEKTVARIARYSGAVYFAAGLYGVNVNNVGNAAPALADGWNVPATAADATTFNRLVLSMDATDSITAIGCVSSFAFVRRYL